MANYIGPNSRRISSLTNNQKSLSADDRMLVNDIANGTVITDYKFIQDTTELILRTEVNNTVDINSSEFHTETNKKGHLKLEDGLYDSYIPSKVQDITTVGNPEDYQLPISGSYLSVNNIDDTYGSKPVGFAERSGNVTLLIPVTNGLTYRWTYSFLTISGTKVTGKHSDIEYRPTGLNYRDGEFIGYCYPPSNKHMLVEIHTTKESEKLKPAELGCFKEYALVELNGTFKHTNHKLIRLGTLLSGINTKISNGHLWAIRMMHTSNVIHQEYNGKHYIIVENNSAISTTETGYRSIKIFELDVINKQLTPSVGWDVTNPLGKKYPAHAPETNGAANCYVLFQDIYTRDPADKDAYAITKDNNHEIYANSKVNSSTHSISGGHFDQNTGCRTLIIYAYLVISDNKIVRKENDHKTLYFMTVDFKNKRIYSKPGNGNQRKIMKHYDGKDWIYDVPDSEILPVISRGHGWMHRRFPQQLQNGVFLSTTFGLVNHIDVQTPKTRITNYDIANPGAVNTSVRFFYIANEKFTIKNSVAVLSIHDKWLNIYHTQGGMGFNAPAWQTYFSQQPSQINRRISYPLTADKVYLSEPVPEVRTTIPKMLHSAVTVVKNNSVHIHTAVFSKRWVESTHEYSLVTANMELSGKLVKLSQNVLNKVNALSRLRPASSVLDPKFSESNYDFWWLTPGITPLSDIGMLRLFRSWTIPNALYRPADHSGIFEAVYFYKTIYTETASEIVVTDLQFFKDPATNPQLFNKVANGSLYGDPWHHSNMLFEIKSDTEVQVYYKNRQSSWGTGGIGYHFEYLRRAELTKTGSAWDYRFNIVDHSSYDRGMISYNNRHGVILSLPDLNNTASVIYKRKANSFEFDMDNPILVSFTIPKDGFTLNITDEIPVYAFGKKYIIPPNSYYLNNYSGGASPANKTFYFWADINRNLNDINFRVSVNPPPEDNAYIIYLGKCITDNNTIIDIDAKPVTRWSNTRPSVDLRGSSFPVSVGFPFDHDVVAWDSGSLRRPRGSYNLDGTRLTGVARGADYVVIQTPLDGDPILNQSGLTMNGHLHIVQVDKANGDAFTFSFPTPHDTGWEVKIRSLLGDPNTGFTAISRPRPVTAPLISKIVSVNWVNNNSGNIQVIDTVKANTRVYLEIVASGLSMGTEDKAVTINWNKVNFIPTDVKGSLPDTVTLRYSDNLRRFWKAYVPVEFNLDET